MIMSDCERKPRRQAIRLSANAPDYSFFSTRHITVSTTTHISVTPVAITYAPIPTAMPTAADMISELAVVRPLTSPSRVPRMMVPAAMKPTHATTASIRRIGST